MPTCCQGPQEALVAYTPCAGGDPVSVTGFAGMQVRKSGEHCAYLESVWASRCWVAEVPGIGSTLTMGGATWYVGDAQYAAPCNLVLSLCRPLMDCPDCTVTVHRLTKGTRDENCLTPLDATQIAASVPATICVTGRSTRPVNGAIIQLKEARICLDTQVEVLPGDYVHCAPDLWRVTEIISTCSPRCLYTIKAELDPFGIFTPS